ncbi:hypothetical protein BXO88_03995 [Oribacterium sp. C9]|uniref:hypothetical protein n=1 Tax=Oribacterium sp. C9 TaxID=1943579 RepID=UPI00098E877A|nr:hypothetical protein [Oribacterium sp. C9]OON87444.1 hypothetical protein BXO88_03995 [Oribacterium sp. C9]
MAGYVMTIGGDEFLSRFYRTKKNGKAYKGNIASSNKEGQRLAKEYALKQCIATGTYSAKTSEKGPAFIGTLADYLGMKPGDDIFFFTERKIYGIGKLVNIGDDCRYRVHSKDDNEDLVEMVNPENHQFICTFEPSPYFFKEGVDTDEILMFSPEKIKALRFFSAMSFVKLDDTESQEVKNMIARKNEQFLNGQEDKIFSFDTSVHEAILKKTLGNNKYRLSVFDYIKDAESKVSSEYYIEGAVMDLLRKIDFEYIGGHWDCICRQYPASPAKPSEYKETMDLFGYRYIKGFSGAISKYLIIELKTGTIKKEHVEQTMKYVDWVSKVYTCGDYSMIEAYTIGFDKVDNIEDQVKSLIERNYILEGHPVKSCQWSDLRIISYRELLQKLLKIESDELI